MLVHKAKLHTGTGINIYLYLMLVAIVATFIVVLSGTLAASNTSVSNEAGFQVHQNTDYNYSIGYPRSWQTIEQGRNDTFTAVSEVTDVASTSGGINFSSRQLLDVQNPSMHISSPSFNKLDVVVYELEYEIPARDFVRAVSPTAIEGSMTQVKVAGKDAIQTTSALATQGIEGSTHDLAYNSVFVTSGKFGYVISGFASPDLFKQILNSFQTF